MFTSPMSSQHLPFSRNGVVLLMLLRFVSAWVSVQPSMSTWQLVLSKICNHYRNPKRRPLITSLRLNAPFNINSNTKKWAGCLDQRTDTHIQLTGDCSDKSMISRNSHWCITPCYEQASFWKRGYLKPALCSTCEFHVLCETTKVAREFPQLCLLSVEFVFLPRSRGGSGTLNITWKVNRFSWSFWTVAPKMFWGSGVINWTFNNAE